MLHRLIKFVLIAITIITVFGFSSAYAQTISSLNVSPAFIEDKLAPGESFNFTIRITNTSNEIKNVVVKIRDIQGFSPNGLPIFPAGEEIDNYEMSKWFRLATSTIVMPAQSPAELMVTVEVPQAATLGRHLAGIFFSESEDIDFSAGAIVSIVVLGDLKEKLEINKFMTDRFIYSRPKVMFDLDISNLGNNIVRPQGQIIISNALGKQIAKLSINDANMPIQPNSSKSFSLVWQGGDLNWGRYQAVFTSVYGQGNKLLTSTASFWILPVHIILGVFFLIIILIALLVLLMKSYIKKKAWQYYQATAEAAGKEFKPKDVPDIVVDNNFNLQRLLLITIFLLVFISALMAALYFIL